MSVCQNKGKNGGLFLLCCPFVVEMRKLAVVKYGNSVLLSFFSIGLSLPLENEEVHLYKWLM